MREIKFRYWDEQEKTMYVSDGLASFFSSFEMLDMPLMQYTGLKDKNGKEIYEGDIVKNILGKISEVRYGFQSCNDCQASYGYGTDKNDILENGSIEVVGVIYENPELLIEPDPPMVFIEESGDISKEQYEILRTHLKNTP